VRVVFSGTDSFATDWLPKFGLFESYFSHIYLGNPDSIKYFYKKKILFFK